MTAVRPPVSISEAIVAFGRGYTFTRSFTHPYEFVRVGPVWVLRDGPRHTGDDRVREILVSGLSPVDALPAIEAAADGHRFYVSAIDDLDADFSAIADGYRESGYRLLRREPLMVRAVRDLAVAEGPVTVLRVQDLEWANRAGQVAGRRLILEEHLARDQSPLRLYIARDGDEILGWVRSIRTGPRDTWVADMTVRPEFRRRGIARSLMTHMLADDARLGYSHSVLLASGVGAKLYASLGYTQIGLLQLFAPKRPASAT